MSSLKEPQGCRTGELKAESLALRREVAQPHLRRAALRRYPDSLAYGAGTILNTLPLEVM
jgi:hypothetical protein